MRVEAQAFALEKVLREWDSSVQPICFATMNAQGRQITLQVSRRTLKAERMHQV